MIFALLFYFVGVEDEHTHTHTHTNRGERGRKGFCIKCMGKCVRNGKGKKEILRKREGGIRN